VSPQDDLLPADSMVEEPNLTKGIVSRLWDWQPINVPHEKPHVLVHNSLVPVILPLFELFSIFWLISSLQRWQYWQRSSVSIDTCNTRRRWSNTLWIVLMVIATMSHSK
jgi:hypothetical protein